MLDEGVVQIAEVGEVHVVLERQHEVATVDLRALVQAVKCVGERLPAPDLDESLGDLALGVAVRR